MFNQDQGFNPHILTISGNFLLKKKARTFFQGIFCRQDFIWGDSSEPYEVIGDVLLNYRAAIPFLRNKFIT